MADVLQRHLGTSDRLDPGQYTTEGCGSVVAAQAIVRCPKCGAVDALDNNQVIAADGCVSERWSCPTITCGYAEYLQLESWTP